jgi:hypothetical protein
MAPENQIYPDVWRMIGIVSDAEIAEDTVELSRGEDPHPEHYRWMRFVKFVHNRPVIDSGLAKLLYSLGECDPEHALGESIISVIIRRDDCPRELQEKALRSSSEHLKRIALARINEKRG